MTKSTKREQATPLPSLEEPEDRDEAFVNHFALHEGWLLSQCDNRTCSRGKTCTGIHLEKDDDNPLFVSDEQVNTHVLRLADEGSALHKAAIRLTGARPMRHLHDGDPDHTLCGYARRVPVAFGSRYRYIPGHASVHYTKARKSDCTECRRIHRAQLRDQREHSIAAAAAQNAGGTDAQ